jgi:hypothetical protein
MENGKIIILLIQTIAYAFWSYHGLYVPYVSGAEQLNTDRSPDIFGLWQ